MKIKGTTFVPTSGYALRMFTDRKYPKYARQLIQRKLNSHENMVLLVRIDDEDYHLEFEYIDNLFGDTDTYLWASVKRFYYNKRNHMQRYHVTLEIYYDRIIVKSSPHDTRQPYVSSIPEFMIEFSKFTDSLMRAILAEIKKISKHED